MSRDKWFLISLIKSVSVLNYHSISGNFEKEYDDVTIKMVFAVAQTIGFFNSICNPFVYAFMNENFKKNFLSAVCYCIVKESSSPARKPGNSGISMMQKRAKLSRPQRPVEETKGDTFSDASIDVKLCEQPREKRQLKRQPAFFSSELSENSTFGSGHEL